MRPGLRIVLWTVAGATLMVALVLGAFTAWLLSEVLPAGTTITVDNERFVVPALTHAGHYLLVVLAVWAVALLVVAAAPLLLLLGLVVPALLGTLGFLLAALIVALLLWPIVLLTRRWWKRGAKQSTISP